MRVLATFVGFGAAFVLGIVLLIVGAVGAEVADCPAALVQFPAVEVRCNLFSGFVISGSAMVMIGGGVASWLVAFGKWPD